MWARIRKQLEAERSRIARDITKYPTPIPACDQDFNHPLATRDRLNEELARLDRAEEKSRAAADPLAAVEEFIRSSSCLRLGTRD